MSKVMSARLLWLLTSASLIAACTEHEPELGSVGGAGSGGSGAAGTGGGPSGGSAGAAGDAAVACAPDPSIVVPTIPCEIDDILERKCRRCHTSPPQNFAPFALLTWAQIHDDYFGKPVYERMRNAVDVGFMPFINPNFPLDPPVEPLEAAERTTLLAWLEDCAKPADGAQCGP